MPIYTRTGDKGTTGLASGQRIQKSSPVVNFIGSLDELNALVGICVSGLDEIPDTDFTEEIEVLEDIQKDLFIVGAIAAGAANKFEAPTEASNIEATIDDYEKLVPALKNFILPGGHPVAAQIHYVRTIVRRIERDAVRLNSLSIMPFLPYLNRLSDLLFMMARYVNHKLKYPETKWITRKSP